MVIISSTTITVVATRFRFLIILCVRCFALRMDRCLSARARVWRVMTIPPFPNCASNSILRISRASTAFGLSTWATSNPRRCLSISSWIMHGIPMPSNRATRKRGSKVSPAVSSVRNMPLRLPTSSQNIASITFGSMCLSMSLLASTLSA